jgi:hypothetical protein
MLVMFLSASFIAAVLAVIVAVVWYVQHTDDSGGKSKKTPRVKLLGQRLPPIPKTKNTAPWNILSFFMEHNLDFGESLGIRFVAGRVGSDSGGGFHANPFKKLPADACVLSYTVYFPADFNFKKGGKLPGLCFGTSDNACSTGGDWSTQSGSFRTIFREDGTCAASVYLALGGKDNAFDAQSSEYRRQGEESGGGHLLWRKTGGLRFKRGQWNTVVMRLILNTPGAANGLLELSLNGQTRSVSGVTLRRAADVKIRTVTVHSFFGGSGSEWAAPAGASLKLSNFHFDASS